MDYSRRTASITRNGVYKMTAKVTKESLAQWIAELESQPHLSLKEERYLAVMKYAQSNSADAERMDWLCSHCVEVRKPLMFGSHAMFHAQQDSEEWDLPHHTTLREQVDEARGRAND